MFKVVCSINHEKSVGVLCLGNILVVKQIPINGRFSYSWWKEKWRGGGLQIKWESVYGVLRLLNFEL